MSDVRLTRIWRATVVLSMLLSASCGNSRSGGTTPASPTPVVGLSCGEERWAVKTLSDPDVSRINFSQVSPTTVSAMNALVAHCNGLPDGRTFAEEFNVFELAGHVKFVALEDDRDYHLALADPNSPSDTMIVESPDPQCEGAVSSPQFPLLRSARESLLKISAGRPPSLVGQTVTVQGVGFYDFNHGQTGRSRSCIELHPVLRIALH